MLKLLVPTKVQSLANRITSTLALAEGSLEVFVPFVCEPPGSQPLLSDLIHEVLLAVKIHVVCLTEHYSTSGGPL